MSKGMMWAKMASVFAVFCIGGPALMYYVTPTEGELFKKFNPELQKRNLELRDERQKNYEDFVEKLKEYSKSDKPIWDVAAEAQRKARDDIVKQQTEQRILQEKMRQEMRAEASGGR